MTLGALGYVGYGLEVTEGTTIAPTIFLPVSAFNFDDTNDYIVPDQIRKSRQRSVALPAPFSTSGSMDMELTPDGVAALFKSAWAAGGGGTVSAGVGPYNHTFTPGNASPTFTFEASAADILIRRYGGIRVNTLDIAGAFGEIVTASFGLEGTTRVIQVTPAAPTITSTAPFHFTGANVKKNDVEMADIKSFNFTTSNNLDRIGTLRKTRSWKRTAFGMFDVGLSATLDFSSDDEYQSFLAEEEFEVEIDLEAGFVTGTSGPRNKLVITIPRVRWNTTSLPITTADYLEQSAEAIILKPSGSPIFTAVLTNNEATVVGG